MTRTYIIILYGRTKLDIITLDVFEEIARGLSKLNGVDEQWWIGNNYKQRLCPLCLRHQSALRVSDVPEKQKKKAHSPK